VLQAALNGGRSRGEHARVPLSAEELARDARACVDAGAGAVHLHPRDEHGRETLDAHLVDAVVARVGEACGVPVGVSTGAWIAGDVAAAVRGWREPAYASVNLSEPAALEVARALAERGIGIEAGVWSVADARRAASLAARPLRVLVEVLAEDSAAAIHAALDAAGVDAPRLQHGADANAWSVLDDAVARRLDTRIGLEDTLVLPDGSPAAGNVQLVEAAVALGAR